MQFSQNFDPLNVVSTIQAWAGFCSEMFLKLKNIFLFSGTVGLTERGEATKVSIWCLTVSPEGPTLHDRSF